MDSPSLRSLVDRYDIPTPTLFLAYIECSKIPAPMFFAVIKKTWSQGFKPSVYNSFKLTNFDDIQAAGKQTFKKFANSWAHSVIVYPKFLRCASPQIAKPRIFMTNPLIANLQISAKCYTILSQSSSVQI